MDISIIGSCLEPLPEKYAEDHDLDDTNSPVFAGEFCFFVVKDYKETKKRFFMRHIRKRGFFSKLLVIPIKI